MDQDSFRTLLSRPDSSKPNPATGGTASTTRTSFLQAGRRQKEPPAPPAPEATFKPRKVVKLPPGYKDRAAERRDAADEFAEGAAKGLNLDLLEKAKAKEGISQLEDDALEEAFKSAAAVETPSDSANLPKKRTRDDLLKALKSKQKPGDGSAMEVDAPPEAKSLEGAKQKGKFRPIGQPAPEAKAKEEKRKKKKRKVATEVQPSETTPIAEPVLTSSSAAEPTPAADPSIVQSQVPQETQHDAPQPGPSKPIRPPTPQDDDDDVDIFADVGEYEGVDLGDDSGDEKPSSAAKAMEDTAASGPIKRMNWFGDAEPEPPVAISRPRPPTTPPAAEKEEGEEEEDKPIRLAPLTSSSIGDIKSFLAADKALEKEEKRKARKEKKKKDQS
ncbi:hypothetical protein FRB90_011674 [Tulasnella sp. 427]|nr:hypothetical protein FRB90_011674 [Tulasnella sp. 427]